jgi:hypothetical protein
MLSSPHKNAANTWVALLKEIKAWNNTRSYVRVTLAYSLDDYEAHVVGKNVLYDTLTVLENINQDGFQPFLD